MAFDKSTRNRLAKFVSDARGVITDEFTEQFQSIYGISVQGDLAPLNKLGHLNDAGLATAALLRDRTDYLEKTHPDDKGGAKAAVTRLAREQAFTILNRLVAIRMAEKRGLIIESVGKGYQSKGFKVFETVAGSTLGDTYLRYRCYLFCLFDELAIDLGVLFDRRSPQALLFPREPALLALLDLLHAADLDPLWAEDETIGWIYQYYNDPEERKKMRKDSAAPRNSRELAVRNQFFTPRYVVEFLTDNTLGRIWYEMSCGKTRLADRCLYLVRRPTEIFLAEGEPAPETPIQDGFSQEELLKQPVHIAHRPIRDPREIRLLDPACGSMHFGLYAFDLFETIYDEAWDNSSCPALQEAYSSKDEYLNDVPRLIIENNIHGIDIDPRAVQIAGLSLWLRAQKAWQVRGLKPAGRPRVRRSNIVCAEPMPGSSEMLQNFVATLDPPLLGELVKTVFDKMQLAGEAGSLLKIEEEIRTAIDTARKEWLNQQDDLLTRMDGSQEEFFETAEQQVIEALRAYAEQAEVDSYQRRLFADDAARGFAFIDLCRKRYDAVVMNPPFGERSESTEKYFQANFPETIGDLLSMFFERALSYTNKSGKIGAITNRTWLSLPTFEGLRTKVFGPNGCVEVGADLGSFVLDAQVETAAATIGRDTPATRTGLWVRLLKTKAKSETLLHAVSLNNKGQRHDSGFLATQQQFLSLPASVYGYWMSGRLISLYRPENSIASRYADVKQGTSTADDFRFLRLAWEICPCDLGLKNHWVRFAKGGEYTPFFDDVHLALYWRNNGEELVAWGRGAPRNSQYFGRCGVTWPRRTTSSFGPRTLPAGCAFGDKGPAAFPLGKVSPYLLLALLVSRPARLLLSVRLGAGDDAPGSASKSYEVGLVRDLPFPNFSHDQSAALEAATCRCVRLVQSRMAEDDETTIHFVYPLLTAPSRGSSIRTTIMAAVATRDSDFIEFSSLSSNIDDVVSEALGFVESDRIVMWEELERPVTSFDDAKEIDADLFKQAYLTKDAINGEALPGGVEAEDDVRIQTQRKRQVALRSPERICRLFEIPPSKYAECRQKFSLVRYEDITDATGSLLQYLVGAVFGRWDIRYATGERPSPELPDPFDPLPICPSGMLQNAEGLPAGPSDVPAKYPLRISWPGILVDDENHLNKDGQSDDIVARVEDALKVIWNGRWEAIEQEACEILGAKSLRDYFRRPTAFFADHLKRYSKSRRQAPIYWPISTKSGSYTLWLYYHSLSDQTLHTCLADFLDPKIKRVQSELDVLTGSGGNGTRAGEMREFHDELKDLRDELERIIKLPWKPNLNDGVLISACPLHRLVRLPNWQKDLKACWDKLAVGDYDWARLAHTIWPKRVERLCEIDPSVAIAHNLKHLCKSASLKTKKPRKKISLAIDDPDDDIENEVE